MIELNHYLNKQNNKDQKYLIYKHNYYKLIY